MVYLIGVLTAVFVVVVAVQALRGRTEVRTCCSYVPPEQDARLRVDDVPAGPRPD